EPFEEDAGFRAFASCKVFSKITMILSVDWNHRGHIGTAFGSSEIGIGNAAVLHWKATPERTVRRIASTTATVRVSPLSRCSPFHGLVHLRQTFACRCHERKKKSPRKPGGPAGAAHSMRAIAQVTGLPDF